MLKHVHIFDTFNATHLYPAINCWMFFISYSMVVLYIWIIIRFWVSCLKILPTNQPNINFVTTWQHWLGIAKPKNVFRSTLNLFIKLLWNFKNFVFNRFFYWLTDWLTNRPTDRPTDWLSDWCLQTSVTQ